jgi:hypothetical protein
VGLTDYLLGQADPIGRADAVRHLKDDPEDLSLATELSQKLLLLAPEADLPRLPGEERRPRVGRRTGPSTGRGSILERLRGPRKAGEAGRMTLTRHQTRLVVGLVCAAVLVVVAVLAATGTFKGGDSNAATATTTSAASTRGQAEGFPLTPLKVSTSGSVTSRTPIPPTLRNLIPRAQALYITRSNTRDLAVAVNQAVQNRQLIIPVSGSPQLVGAVGSPRSNEIPIDLNAVKGARGTGSASVDVSDPKNPVLNLKLTNLQVLPKKQTYIVWFVFGLSK